MIRSSPVVSLGMPAYNSGKFIAQSIEALLAQTYRDFELIISNNASTDGTGVICEKYVGKDKRIRLYHRESTVDMFQNFEAVFRPSRGKYFAWVGSHDLWHPDWLANLVGELESQSSVVLAYPQTVSITDEGENIPDSVPLFETFGKSKLERFYKVCSENYRAGPIIHGLFRTEILNELLPFSRVTLADKQMAVEVSIFGEIKQVKKDLWYRRHIVKRSSYKDILESQIDERVFGDEIPFHANFPYISHTIALFIKYCLLPKNQNYSHFWNGLLMTIMYWEGKRSKIERELKMLDEFIKLKPEHVNRSYLLPFADSTFLEGVIQSILGYKINQFFSSADLHNVLTLGFMLYHHHKSTNQDYEIEGGKASIEIMRNNAQYWHFEAGLHTIIRDRIKKMMSGS